MYLLTLIKLAFIIIYNFNIIDDKNRIIINYYQCVNESYNRANIDKITILQ